jgi:hypothetical protein
MGASQSQDLEKTAGRTDHSGEKLRAHSAEHSDERREPQSGKDKGHDPVVVEPPPGLKSNKPDRPS